MGLTVLFAFIIGLMVGSFLNVCIYRLPQGQAVTIPRSHCVHCKAVLRVYDLIPLFSYSLLKGRCRYCNRVISLRYVLVEVVAGSLFSLCLIIVGTSLLLIKILAAVCFFIVITFIDYDHQLILDKVVIWFAATGLVINLIIGHVTILDMAIAGAAGGSILLLIAIVSKGGMGDGDIKFMAALGLWLGLKMTLLTVFLAFVIGGIVSSLLLVFKIRSLKDLIPFGPFIAMAASISMLYGNKIISWYLQAGVQ